MSEAVADAVRRPRLGMDMPHQLVALLIIFGTIALMVAWIPCMDCTSRFFEYIYTLFGGGKAPEAKGHPAKPHAGSARKAA